MKKVAIIGTQGVPANYGGFESLAENIIGKHCSPGIRYTIFCSSKDMPDRRKRYKKCRLKYIPFHANGIQSIIYDILSMVRAIGGYDVILVLGVSGCIFLPVLKIISRSKIIVNIDGLEHKREKWGKWARRFLRLSEHCAVRLADVVVADNKGIKDYVRNTYHKDARLIAYGGDHTQRKVPEEIQKNILEEYNLTSGNYYISICRIEPENNSHIILSAFETLTEQLVFVGNWNRNEYSQSLKNKYKDFPNMLLIDSVYDLDILFTLRNHCRCYIHGHSAGGTNPSLVEAMFFGKPIFAYNVVYNRETTNNAAFYFQNKKELQCLLQQEVLEGSVMKEIANAQYTWEHIAAEYEALYNT